ncbi:hypothetical protein [Photobacterium sp. R1]
MNVVLADASSSRIVIMETTSEVVAELLKRGVDVPLVEIDGNQDNLFVAVRDKDYLSGFYIGIEHDDGMVNIWLNERGHSGGDPTLESFDFLECELNSNLDRICELFTNAPKF